MIASTNFSFFRKERALMDVSNRNDRNSGMDLARIVATFMVICMHVTATWKYGKPTTLEWHVSEIYDALCRSAVPLFFMMSGAFYKNQCVSKTIIKIFRYIVVFFAISLVYTINDMVLGTQETGNLLERILNYKYHLWYLPAFVYVLSIAPLIVKIMDSDENGQLTRYMLALWIIFGICMNTISIGTEGWGVFSRINRLSNFISSFAFLSKNNHVGYFILGRYMIKAKTTKKQRNTIYLLGILSTVALYGLTVVYSYYDGKGDNRWMSTLNIFVLLQAIGLFEFFKNLNLDDKLSMTTGKLKEYTFGIYLVHVLFLEWADKLNIFCENEIMGFGIATILVTPLRVVVIWLMSLFFVWIFQKFHKMVKNIISSV